MGSLRVGHDWATAISLFTFTFHFHALEKEMATHSSVLAWRIPGTGEPRGLPSLGSHRVGHDWSNLAAAAACISQILSKLYTMTTTLINGESIYCSLANSGLLFLCPWHSELHWNYCLWVNYNMYLNFCVCLFFTFLLRKSGISS